MFSKAKKLKKAEREKSHGQLLAQNLVHTLAEQHPAMAVTLNSIHSQATVTALNVSRGGPMTSLTKQKFLDIAFAKVRGTKNLQRLFACNNELIYLSVLSSGMMLHALQIGSSIINFMGAWLEKEADRPYGI